MSLPGSPDRPLRVAIVGAGPAGFYTTQHLFQARDMELRVDMFDRLPTPFGLVRHGVAPDHQKIKSVNAVYDRLARDPRFRFFGNVEYGKDLSLADLREHYDQVVFSTGAQTDRRLGIPGEDLTASHPATDFVAWYNGHPDYADHRFELDARSVVVVGVGNVAVDVARILLRTPEELAATDIADHALEALARSSVREVYLLGRRGPAQAAFTNPEVRELGELPGAETTALADEVELDPLSRQALADNPDKAVQRKLDILSGLVGRSEPDKSRKLILRFLVSPLELTGDDGGRVRGVRMVKNELFADGNSLRPRPTEVHETLEAQLVFRSVGYHGVPLATLPFDKRRGVIPNTEGRIVADSTQDMSGLYVSGWIKRGPSGVIGTNKPDAKETVNAMLEDVVDGKLVPPQKVQGSIEALLKARGVAYIGYDDWLRLDAIELARGKEQGRPRVKFARREEIRSALRD